jgi:hypothetical protein
VPSRSSGQRTGEWLHVVASWSTARRERLGSGMRQIGEQSGEYGSAVTSALVVGPGSKLGWQRFTWRNARCWVWYGALWAWRGTTTTSSLELSRPWCVSVDVSICFDAVLCAFSGSARPCARVASAVGGVCLAHDARVLRCRAGALRASTGDAARSTRRSLDTTSATAPPVVVRPGRFGGAAVYSQAMRSCGAGAPQAV